MSDLNDVKARKTVDARAMACPGPLLEAKKAIGGVGVGEVLEILSGDKGSREDIPAWCRMTGDTLLRAEPPVYWIRARAPNA